MPCTLSLKTSGILKRCLEVFIMQKSEGIVTRRGQAEVPDNLLKTPKLRYYEAQDCPFTNYFLYPTVNQYPLRKEKNSTEDSKKKTLTLRPVDWRPI